MFAVPTVEAPAIKLHTSHAPPSYLANMQHLEETLHHELMPKTTFMHPIARGMKVQFPEVRLIQYDCGKLLVLLNSVAFNSMLQFLSLSKVL